jgi:hypothetical protein
MSIENDMERTEQRVESLEKTLAVLADLVDDWARERHDDNSHDGGYERCGHPDCFRARSVMKLV